MNLATYLKTGFIVIAIVLGLNNYRLHKKVDRLDNELSNTTSNLKQYESLVNGSKNDNRVLQLTIDDFKESQDSLLQVINKQAKNLKIKDDKLKQVSSVNTILHDTFEIEVSIKEINFCVELKPNQLTEIKIQRVDSIITCIPTIYNRQDLFVYEEKVWRRKKNIIQRIFTLDFKKDKINRYQILNSNDLIQTLDTRVINLSK